MGESYFRLGELDCLVVSHSENQEHHPVTRQASLAPKHIVTVQLHKL